MKKLFVVLTMLVVAVAALGLPVSSFAQEAGKEERITLSPAISRPELSAGERATSKLTVINDGQTDYEVVLYARPFSVTNEQYDPDYTEVNERTQAYQWVQFENTRISLKPGDRAEVPYEISVPENAAGGGHYAVLFAETQPKQDGSNVARKKRVGSLLYMTIKGEVRESGSIDSWEARLFQTKPPIESTLRVKNDGNVHFQANVQAQYVNIFGKKQFELNREVIVLPGTTRKIVASWEGPPYFGIFRAKATVEYLDKTETLPARWVVLVPIPLLIGLAALVTAIILYKVIRHRKKGNMHDTVSKKKR